MSRPAAVKQHDVNGPFVLEVTGTALVKGRPRLGRGRTYTPENTVRWENRLRADFIERHGWPRLSGPVRVRIEFHQKRGDLDNLAKAVLDAFNDIAYGDDSQVCSLTVTRPWEPTGKPWTRITIEGMTL